MAAIVTDARYRMALAAVRNLGEAGVPVICVEDASIPEGDVLSFRSRYAHRRLRTPSPAADPVGFVAALAGAAGPDDVVIPVALASVLALAEFGPRYAGQLRFVLPPVDTIRLADDTSRLLEVAEKAGVPVPETTYVAEGETPEQAASRMKFPVVIKYRHADALFLPPRERYAIVRDRAEFLRTYPQMAGRQASPIIQEYIPGTGWGMAAILDRQRQPLAVFAHRRIREYPASGGPSSFCESVHDESLIEYGVRLLQALGWVGVAMVEFRRDARTGQFRLMEINPRFWGSLPLAIYSGVNFPLILYRLAREEGVAPHLRYHPGVRMRYILQDLLSVPGYLRRVPSRGRFVLGFARDLLDPRVHDGVFRWNDLAPSWTYLARALRRVKGGGHGQAN